MRKSYFLALTALAMSLFSCQQFDELENLSQVKYDAEYAIPLVDTKTTLQDILEGVGENSSIIINPDNSINLRYRTEVTSQTSDDILRSINESLPPLIPITSKNMPLPFSSPDGLDIDRLDMKGGNLIYFFENRHPESIDVTITFPQIRKNNVPLTLRQNVSAYSGSGNAPAGTNLFFPTSLEGYQIITENDLIYVQYEAVRASGATDTVSNFFIRLEDLSFAYAEGYFGEFLYEGSRDTLQIDFFDNFIQGDVYFEEPKITLFVENSFGFPTRGVINTLNVITVNNEVLSLESPFVINGIDFPFPMMNEVGIVKTGEFSFTKQNSNIDVILGAGPVAIDYDIDAVTNAENNPNLRGFITDSSYYKVDMQVDIPLFGRATGFVTTDTFDVNFTDYQDVDDAEFKLVVDNAIPLEIEVQAYFMDDKGTVIDSLLDAPQRIVDAAPVDSQGQVTGETRKITFAPFSAERFAKIKTEATQVLLNAAFSTNNDGTTSVRIFSNQELRIKLGAIFGVRNGG